MGTSCPSLLSPLACCLETHPLLPWLRKLSWNGCSGAQVGISLNNCLNSWQWEELLAPISCYLLFLLPWGKQSWSTGLWAEAALEECPVSPGSRGRACRDPEEEQRQALLTLAAGPLPTLWVAGCPFLLLHAAASCIPGIARSSPPLPGWAGAELRWGKGMGCTRCLA